MKHRMRINRVRLGALEYRVIQPARPVQRVVLHDDDRWLSMYVDHDAAIELVAVWGLAARSPRSLVYLPTRGNVAPEGVGSGEGVSESLDLVLLHHSLQFPAPRWKQVRARLGPGQPHGAKIADDEFPDEAAIDYRRRYFREFRDHLGFDIAAHTLFIVGSPTAFREQGASIRTLIDEAPSYLTRYPAARHFCVELSAGLWARPQTRGRVPGHLHIQYCADWRI